MDTNEQFHLSQVGKEYSNEDPCQTRNLTEHEESFHSVDLLKKNSAIIHNEESLQIWDMDKKQVFHLSQEATIHNEESLQIWDLDKKQVFHLSQKGKEYFRGQTCNLTEHKESFQTVDVSKTASAMIRNEEVLRIWDKDKKQVFHLSQEGKEYSNEDSGHTGNLTDYKDSLQPLEKSKTTSSVTSKGKVFHRCDMCHILVYKKEDLAAHRLTHTVQKSICGICKREFALQDELEAHCLSHKIGNKFVCHVCEKTFHLRSDLQRHLVTHNPNRWLICDICRKCFKTSYSHSQHMLTHTGKKSHICKICQKAFLSKSNLNKHLMIHRQDKPFVCDICRKAFDVNESLKIHRRTHSGIKLTA